MRSMILILLLTSWALAQPKTFCNPLDLDYGFLDRPTTQPCRHGADPVIVLYKNRYYLFSTWDKPGYRASDDLVTWTYIPFAKDSDLFDKTYTAASVIELDSALYFTEFGTTKKPVSLYRTRAPDTGRWEKVADLAPYADPCLFLDPRTKKLFMYYGLEKPIRGVELDPTTFQEIPNTNTQLLPPVDPTHIRDGWEICTQDNSESSPPMRGNKTFLPCREGSWMTFHNNTYYLQYASPGTTVPGYADGLLTSASPLGPFTYSNFSPISHKPTGFITSAGHSCLFQDRHNNWWRAVTMLIGVRHRFERRIGLFPAGFDADGIPYTRTDSDLPITIPDGPRDHLADVTPHWGILSLSKLVTASSTLDADHAPARAADEDIRTHFSAKTNAPTEWLGLDLERPMEIHAIQINFAEQDCTASANNEPHRFTISASSDGSSWTTLSDQSTSSQVSPHPYVHLAKPITARYIKLQNISMPANGKFAVSDLRVFGIDPQSRLPDPITTLSATRDTQDRRKVTLTWTPTPRATTYLLRYGIQPTKLYQHHLIPGGASSLTLYNLNQDPPYHFRLDALNPSGATAGSTVISTPR